MLLNQQVPFVSHYTSLQYYYNEHFLLYALTMILSILPIPFPVLKYFLQFGNLLHLVVDLILF